MIGVVGLGFIGGALYREMGGRGFVRGSELDFSGLEVVYQCGGVSGGAGFASEHPLAMVGENLRLHLDVFDAALRDGVKQVVVMSSTTGYPDRENLSEDEFFDGEVAGCYVNPGETRRFIEKLGMMYPFDVTFIRCPGVYGPGANFGVKSHVIEATIRKVAERQDPLICWGDGEDLRDAVHIDDLVSALKMVKGWKGKNALNVATGRMMSVNGMIKVLCEHAGYKPEVIHDMSKPQMIRKRLLDVSKAISMGWEAKISMEDGLRSTLDWYAGI